MKNKSDVVKGCREFGRFMLMVFCLVWVKLIVHGTVIYLFHDYLEAHKFYLDAGMIYHYYDIIEGSWIPDRLGDGYRNIARFYRLVFLNQDLSRQAFYLASSLLYALVYHLMVLQLPIKNKRKFFLFSMIFIFDAVYLFQPSKEITALLLSILVMHQIKKKASGWRNFWILTELLIYAALFRIYFAIMACFYMLYLIFRKSKILAGILTLAGFALFCVLYQKGYLTRLLEAKIVVEDANTALTDLFTKEQMADNVFLYLLNYAVMVVRLIFPVEIIVKSPSRAVLFLPIYWYMLFEVVRCIRSLWAGRTGTGKNNRVVSAQEQRKLLDVVVIICSHILTSAFFEPDFGSYLRHVVGILPFYYFIMFCRTDCKTNGKKLFSGGSKRKTEQVISG